MARFVEFIRRDIEKTKCFINPEYVAEIYLQGDETLIGLSNGNDFSVDCLIEEAVFALGKSVKAVGCLPNGGYLDKEID